MRVVLLDGASITPGAQYCIAKPGFAGRYWIAVVAPEGIATARELLDLVGLNTVVIEYPCVDDADDFKLLH